MSREEDGVKRYAGYDSTYEINNALSSCATYRFACICAGCGPFLELSSHHERTLSYMENDDIPLPKTVKLLVSPLAQIYTRSMASRYSHERSRSMILLLEYV